MISALMDSMVDRFGMTYTVTRAVGAPTLLPTTHGRGSRGARSRVAKGRIVLAYR